MNGAFKVGIGPFSRAKWTSGPMAKFHHSNSITLVRALSTRVALGEVRESNYSYIVVILGGVDMSNCNWE